MLTFEWLLPGGASSWGGLAYPRFRGWFSAGWDANRVLAVGAAWRGRPVGMVLCWRHDSETAEILSLFVLPEARRLGIGGGLLARAEEELKRSGCLEVRIVYSSALPAVEALLRSRAWAPPVPRMLVGRCDVRMAEAPWMRRATEPAGLESFPVSDLSAAELHALTADVDSPLAFPESHWYSSSSEPLESAVSLGLRRGTRVVAWLLVHRISPGTLRYTHLYVRPEERGRAAGLHLLSRVIRRHCDVFGNKADGIFAVSVHNRSMVRFVRQRMVPFLVSQWESRGARKRL